jgi:hypothetical protein
MLTSKSLDKKVALTFAMIISTDIAVVKAMDESGLNGEQKNSSLRSSLTQA